MFQISTGCSSEYVIPKRVKNVTKIDKKNLFNNFNVTVFVNSDTTKRKQRVLKRGVTEDYFKLMNNKQIKENIKKNKSTFIVNNNGSILNLRLNIIKLLNKL